MKKRLLLFIALFLGIGAVACFFCISEDRPFHYLKQHTAIKTVGEAPLEEAQLTIKRPLFLLALGDSLTEGVGDPLKQGYVGIVKQKLEETYNATIQLQNKAKRGKQSAELLKQLQKKSMLKSIRKADVIVLTIGGNDVMDVFKNHFFHLKIPLFEEKSEEYGSHLSDIITLLREHNKDAPVFMLGLFNPYFTHFSEIVEINEIVQLWNEKSQSVLNRYENTYFIAIDQLFAVENVELLHDDHFHPNRLGYERIAHSLLREIEEEFLPQIREN